MSTLISEIEYKGKKIDLTNELSKKIELIIEKSKFGGIGMDHLIEKFDVYLDSEFNSFYEELKSGEYGTKYSNQPSYDSLKALVDSVNILRKFYGWETLSIKEMITYKQELFEE